MKLKLFITSLALVFSFGLLSSSVASAAAVVDSGSVTDPASQQPVPRDCVANPNLKKCTDLNIPDTCPGGLNYNKVAAIPKNCPFYDPSVKGSHQDGASYFFDQYLNPFIKFLSASVGVIVVISIILGAIQYSSAGGEAQKVAAARNRIKNSILALIVFIFLYAILQWVLPGGIGG